MAMWLSPHLVRLVAVASRVSAWPSVSSVRSLSTAEVAYAAAAKGIGSLLGGSTQLRNAFARLGGQTAITNAYLAAIMSLAVAGAAVVLFGLAPRASVAGAWTVVGVMVLIALFGQVLRLSQWVLDVSPFTHVPKLPGVAVTVHTTGAPLLWLGLAALALAVTGLAGLRRRDIG